MPPRVQSLPRPSDLLSSRGSASRRAQAMQQLPPAHCIMGIDPGLHRTGYGVIEVGGSSAPTVVEAGILTAKATDALPRRLNTLYDGLCEVLQEQQPEVVVIEELFST